MDIPQFARKLWPIVDVVLLILSLFAIILVVIGALMTVENVATHRRYVWRLEEAGQVTQGTVDFQSPEHDWIFIEFTDAQGETRSTVLEMKFYPESAWERLTPGTQVAIRYLPYPQIGSDRIVLEREFERVKDYVGFFENDAGTVFLVCWAILILKPQVLYLGLVDIDKLGSLGGLEA